MTARRKPSRKRVKDCAAALTRSVLALQSEFNRNLLRVNPVLGAPSGQIFYIDIYYKGKKI